jgi:hypothetical protein
MDLGPPRPGSPFELGGSHGEADVRQQVLGAALPVLREQWLDFAMRDSSRDAIRALTDHLAAHGRAVKREVR